MHAVLIGYQPSEVLLVAGAGCLLWRVITCTKILHGHQKFGFLLTIFSSNYPPISLRFAIEKRPDWVVFTVIDSNYTQFM